MSWVEIVDSAMIASGFIKQAAVFTKDGFLAASSPGFTVCRRTLRAHYAPKGYGLALLHDSLLVTLLFKNSR
jgi:hypothetical protein